MSADLLAHLWETRQGLITRSRTIADAVERESRDLTATERKAYDEIDADLAALDARIADVLDADVRAAQLTGQFQRIAGRTGGLSSSSGAADEWLPSLRMFAEWREQRAIGTTGAAIPVMYADRYFDQIRKTVGVLAAGPVLIPVEHAGSIKIPAGRGSVTVAQVAEGAAIAASDPTLATVTLDPKKTAALTYLTSEAADDSNPSLRNIAANALVRDVAVWLDQQFVAGDGTGENMLGLLNQGGVTAGPSLGANGASLSGAAGFAALADSMAAYEIANLDPDKAAWLMHARTWASIRKLSDSQARPLFALDPTRDVRPTLFGKPVYITNNIPVNQTQGTSTDCSSILLADFSQVVVAVARDPELQVSTDFKFDSDLLTYRITCRMDIGLPQPTAVVKTTGLRP